MKASDTVMDSETLVKYLMPLDYIPTGVYKAIEEQAEISFKAGQEQVRNYEFNPDYLDFQKGVEEDRQLGKQAGIQEVVEWVNQMSHIEQSLVSKAIDGAVYRTMSEKDWQSKLKEWGVSGKQEERP